MLNHFLLRKQSKLWHLEVKKWLKTAPMIIHLNTVISNSWLWLYVCNRTIKQEFIWRKRRCRLDFGSLFHHGSHFEKPPGLKSPENPASLWGISSVWFSLSVYIINRLRTPETALISFSSIVCCLLSSLSSSLNFFFSTLGKRDRLSPGSRPLLICIQLSFFMQTAVVVVTSKHRE